MNAVAEGPTELTGMQGNPELRRNEPLARHTTWRAGGPADLFFRPRSLDSLRRFLAELPSGTAVTWIGLGSNLLVRDGGIRGAVIHPGKGEFDQVRVEGNRLVAGAGARLKKIASAARNAGLGGFEWMEGIPGNLGGALRMNAGAMGSQTFDQVVSVRLLDKNGELREKTKDEIEHHYRNVPELDQHFAVSAVLEGKPADLAEIDAKLEESHTHRKESQPVSANAGCMFKNPGAIPAGKLVDELGLKGRAHGTAVVSDVHGNFITNMGGATAREVLDLITDIKQAALQERGIAMETEVQIIGEDEPMGL
jgi:UDP-N-acetylenolpyruvoylglucosamine reductase